MGASVVLSIGLSLIGVGVGSFGGGTSAKDYGSLENLACLSQLRKYLWD